MGQLEHICTLKNVLLEHLYHKPLLEPKALFDELMGYRAALEPYVGDAVGFVHRALKEGRRVLLEGQLGSMKDPNLGICPMTTSLPIPWRASAPWAARCLPRPLPISSRSLRHTPPPWAPAPSSASCSARRPTN